MYVTRNRQTKIRIKIPLYLVDSILVCRAIDTLFVIVKVIYIYIYTYTLADKNYILITLEGSYSCVL